MRSNLSKDITIIIILYKTPLNKILNLKRYKHFKLILFEQNALNDSKKKIKKLLNFDFEYYYSNENLGLARAMNLLIKKTKTKYCMVTEPDITIDKKSIIKLKKIISKKRDFILVGPRFKKIKRNNEYEITKKIDLSCVLFETKRMLKFNFYDEDFFFFWTDIDLLKRVNESSFKMAISNNSFASHKMSRSSNKTSYVSFLRDKSYKYGELVFDYKYRKLRVVKIFRQLIQNLVKVVFYIIMIDKNNLMRSLGYIFGIIEFLKFLIKKTFKGFF